ncbi:MAG: hypothetical protein ACREA0_14645, partial [bacterium]
MTRVRSGAVLAALAGFLIGNGAALASGERTLHGSNTGASSTTGNLSSTRGSGYALCGTPAPLHLDENADGCSIGPTYYVGLQSFVPGGPCGEIAVTAAPIDLLWGRVHENVTDLHLPSAGADVLIRRRYAPDKISTSLFAADIPFNWTWQAHLVYDSSTQLPTDIQFHRTPDRVYPYEQSSTGDPPVYTWYPSKGTNDRDYLNHTFIKHEGDEFIVKWEPQQPWWAGFWDHDYTTPELRGRLKWYYGPEGHVRVNYDGSYRPSSIVITNRGETEEYRQLDLSYVTITSVDYLSRVVVREGDGDGNIIAIVDYT